MLEWSNKNSYTALYYTSPPTVDEWIWPNVGKLLAGELSPKEAASVAQETNQRWFKKDRRLADNFREWQSQVTATSK